MNALYEYPLVALTCSLIQPNKQLQTLLIIAVEREPLKSRNNESSGSNHRAVGGLYLLRIPNVKRRQGIDS